MKPEQELLQELKAINNKLDKLVAQVQWALEAWVTLLKDQAKKDVNVRLGNEKR